MSILDFFAATDDLGSVGVEHAQFVVVSAEGSDHPLHDALVPILARVRSGLQLNVLFVAQFIGGLPVVRRSDQGGLGPQDSDPLEVEYCRTLLEGEEGRRVTLFTAPVISKDGRRYGTVCCTARHWKHSSSVGEKVALASIARIVALAASRVGEEPAGDSVWASSAAAPLGLG